ncbi:MAG: hypothetical protein RLZZ385_1123 [Pseudomonadota bacterium]|jgi:hypothetical protein
MMIASGQNLFWRLSDSSGRGSDAVSVVLTNHPSATPAEVQIQTAISANPFPASTAAASQDIEWDQRDLELFVTLLHKTLPADTAAARGSVHIELDLSDDQVVHIMHVVAAARFASAYLAAPVINDWRSLPVLAVGCQVGDLISIDTIDGFKPCVVVADNEDTLDCILLEEITSPRGDNIRLGCHDKVILKRGWALPANFSARQPAAQEALH